MIFLNYKTHIGISLLLLLSLNSCFINRERMFKIPKDGTFVYDSIPLNPYEDYKIAVNDRLTIDINTNGGKNLIEALTATSVEGSARGSGSSINGNLNGNVSGSSNYLNSLNGFLVKNNGTADIPIIGELYVAGLTIQQCQDTLEFLLKNQYQDPFIQLRVSNRRCMVFNGTANSATVVQLINNNTTLLEVLANTGGISTIGNSSLIRIMRKVKDKREIYLIDLSTIEGLKYSDMIIQGDDYIYIEPREKLIMGTIAEFAPISTLISSAVLVFSLIKNF
jgi:polysaccharide export outer membrane protein